MQCFNVLKQVMHIERPIRTKITTIPVTLVFETYKTFMWHTFNLVLILSSTYPIGRNVICFKTSSNPVESTLLVFTVLCIQFWERLTSYKKSPLEIRIFEPLSLKHRNAYVFSRSFFNDAFNIFV
jgi:hypothetical protein